MFNKIKLTHLTPKNFLFSLIVWLTSKKNFILSGTFISIVQGNKLTLKRCRISNNDEYYKIIEEDNMPLPVSKNNHTVGLYRKFFYKCKDNLPNPILSKSLLIESPKEESFFLVKGPIQKYLFNELMINYSSRILEHHRSIEFPTLVCIFFIFINDQIAENSRLLLDLNVRHYNRFLIRFYCQMAKDKVKNRLLMANINEKLSRYDYFLDKNLGEQ